MSEKIYSPYFSIAIDNDQIGDFKEKIKENLISILSSELSEKQSIKELPDSHITISYTLGNATLEKLQQFAEEMTQDPFKIRVTGIRAIQSKYYNGTIIALILENSEDYLYSRVLLKEMIESQEQNFSVKNQKSTGGFEAHISLFVIPTLREGLKHSLAQYLEQALGGVGRDVYANNLQVFDSYRQKIIEMKFG